MKPEIKKTIGQTTKPRHKIREYSIQLLIVVLGIVITFTMNDIIGKYNQKREIRKAMQIVKEELLLNKETLYSVDTIMKMDTDAAKFFKRHQANLASIPTDSLSMYGSRLFFWYSVPFAYDAMEMLQTSGVFQKVEDSEVAFVIIKAYREIKQAEDVYIKYSDIKTNLQRKIDDNPELVELLLENVENDLLKLWGILLAHAEGKALINQIPQIINIENGNIIQQRIQSIDAVLKMIDEKYD